MKIEQINIKNYKALKGVSINGLGTLCVFIGENGTGKSTFFDVFSFLSDCLQHNATVAVNKRGGFKELLSRGCDSKEDVLEFEVKFRDTSQKNPPLITYFLQIKEENGKSIVLREILKYRRGSHGQPWHFLDFSNGSGNAISNEEAYGTGTEATREEQSLSSAEILAIKGLGQFKQFKAVSLFRNLLERWYISNFKIESARTTSDVGVATHLSESGENLAQVAKYLHDNHKNVYEEILEKLPQRIKGINKVDSTVSEDGRILLRFGDENFKDPFIARYVSDGTLKMFAYMVLLYHPEPFPLLCIEEPENYLYPELLRELVEEIREYAARGGQVFVTTHSPDLLDALHLDEVFEIKKDRGFSSISKLADNALLQELSKENGLGWLWRHNYFIAR